jgi:hypothetical protein
MPWWAWVLIGLGAVALVGVGFVTYLAALFTKGDAGEWPL